MAATLKIALVSRTIFYAPVWVAEQNGYFQDEGVDARFENFDNAEKINEVMHAGVAQIASGTPATRSAAPASERSQKRGCRGVSAMATARQ